MEEDENTDPPLIGRDFDVEGIVNVGVEVVDASVVDETVVEQMQAH